METATSELMIGTHIWTPYCGAAPTPASWLASWNFDPVLLIVLAGAAFATMQWPSPARSVQAARLAAIAVAGILFVTPFCVLGSALFSVRAVHHVLLVTLLAPLISEAFALQERRPPGSLAVWTALQALVFWFWHAPPAYAAALSNDFLFWAMQVSITGTAVVWFAHLRAAGAGAAAMSLLATMVQMGLLGALLVFAGRAFYAPHWLATSSWGLSPLEDQQIAGLIMWAPASAIYLLAAVVVLYRSLAAPAAR
jgi:putative membrane protein